MGGLFGRPEALAGKRLVHHAEDRFVAIQQSDERAPKRAAHDEGAGPVDGIDDPAVTAAGVGRAVLLADQTMARKAGFERLGDRFFRGSIGGRDRVKARIQLVFNSDRLAEMLEDCRAAQLSESVCAFQKGFERYRGFSRHFQSLPGFVRYLGHGP